MRTLSETILEPATTTEEEIKKETTNVEVTAGTFGFQGEVINNEEIIMVRCMSVLTPLFECVQVECNDADKDAKQPVEESQPATTVSLIACQLCKYVCVGGGEGLLPLMLDKHSMLQNKQIVRLLSLM